MPVVVALLDAMTLNKSQGQTLDTVGLDLRDDSFSHGHTYVGFGRVRGATRVKVLVREHRVVDGAATIRNVVYPQLLRRLRNVRMGYLDSPGAWYHA